MIDSGINDAIIRVWQAQTEDENQKVELKILQFRKTVVLKLFK
jgi:hypothetical protein